MFEDRADAGRQLAAKLGDYADRKDVVVIGLPRGGVVVAAEVAKALRAPLDIVVPRKLGYPGNPEYAIGALTEEGIAVMNPSFEAPGGSVPAEYLTRVMETEQREAQRRLKHYRGERASLDLEGKTAIVVDDGIATGATMRAAIVSARHKGAKRVIVAVPVTARDSKNSIAGECDDFIAVESPLFFGAVGAFYKSFPQTSDGEVVKLLRS